MSANRTVRVQCKFARGGFSHERKFLIAAPGGGHYAGTAYISYCFRESGERLLPEEPPVGKQMNGWLEARVVEETKLGLVTIAVPDGDVCDISEDLIQELTNVSV